MDRQAFANAFDCTVVQWNEWNGETYMFSAIQHGVLIMADSLDLLADALCAVIPFRRAA